MRAVILVWDCLGSHLGTGCPAPGQGVSGRAWRCAIRRARGSGLRVGLAPPPLA